MTGKRLRVGRGMSADRNHPRDSESKGRGSKAGREAHRHTHLHATNSTGVQGRLGEMASALHDNFKMEVDRMEPLWWLTKDGDRTCLKMYERHYSAYQYQDGRSRNLFAGPGEKLVLRTWRGDALFVWRKFIDASGQKGINCAVFRNESGHRSSDLIRQADAIADHCWPGQRHYTYINQTAVRSARAGYCFECAGWRRAGRTQGGLLVLEMDDRCGVAA